FDGATGALLQSFYAFEPALANGASVAVGDVNGDGFDDIITGAGVGGGPAVVVFDGASNAVLRSFFAYPASYTGGVRVGAADVNQDGAADLLIAPGSGRPQPVLTLDGKTLAQLSSDDSFSAAAGGAFVGGHG